MIQLVKQINNFFTSVEKISFFQNTKRTLLIGITVILLFNLSIYITTNYIKIKKIQSREETTGLSHDKAQHFIYFYYYTGYFPLSTLNTNLKYSKKDALNEIKNNGNNLIMEYGHWSRLGENLRILTYYPNAIIRGTPKNPSVKLFNTLIFILGLIFIFIAFVKIKKALLGSILVLIINITPFFIYEIYQTQNILALLASVFLIVLGLNLKFLFNKKIPLSHSIFLSLISGIIIGLSSEIRGETLIIIGSVILIYLFSNSIKNTYKLIPILLIVLSLSLTKKAVNYYFENNFKSTYKLVKEHKGHTYDGKRIKEHRFWHPIFCGLGDFDTKYGYKWNDKIAYNYALPILKTKYNINYNYKKNALHFNAYYDNDSLYYIKFDDIDEYEEIMQNKVLSDIKSDPIWYTNILFKRIINILSITLPFSFLGWITLMLLFILIKTKQWNYFKLIIISLPLSFTPFVIYSGDGTTYNSFFSILTLSIIIYKLILFYLKKQQKKY